jgi:hypothetical protein
MPRVGALYGVDREEADGVDRIALDTSGPGYVACAVNHHQIVTRAVRFGRHQACPRSGEQIGDLLSGRDRVVSPNRPAPRLCDARIAANTGLKDRGGGESIANGGIIVLPR